MTLDDIARELTQIDGELRALVAPLGDAQANWEPQNGRRWSVRQNVSHMALTKTVYVRAMRRTPRRAPGRPCGVVEDALGPCGRWFLRILEPPPRVKAPAPPSIQPASTGTLGDAVAAFLAAQDLARALAREVSASDLRATFPNPFFGLLRVRLATGLLVLAAHDRRHLWQIRQVLAAPGFPSA